MVGNVPLIENHCQPNKTEKYRKYKNTKTKKNTQRKINFRKKKIAFGKVPSSVKKEKMYRVTFFK